MPNHPPLKSAENKPRILGISSFTQKYSSMIPKREIGSPYDKHLQKSAVKVSEIEKLLEKKPGTNRLKQGSAEAIRNIINR